MEMQVSEHQGFKKIALKGRLDTAGVSAIEARFSAAVVPAGQNTVVDLSEVAFLASLGVRMFVTTTRTLAMKGGRMALYGATGPVVETIEVMDFADLVPVVGSEAEAIALVQA